MSSVYKTHCRYEPQNKGRNSEILNDDSFDDDNKLIENGSINDGLFKTLFNPSVEIPTLKVSKLVYSCIGAIGKILLEIYLARLIKNLIFFYSFLVVLLFCIALMIVAAGDKIKDPSATNYVFYIFVILIVILFILVIVLCRQPQNRQAKTFQVEMNINLYFNF